MSIFIDCGGCNCCAFSGELPCAEGCCKCPCTGDLSFDIIDCQAYHVVVNPEDGMDNWAPIDSCCTGMSFGLEKRLGYEICSMTGHSPSTVEPDGSGCLTTGTGAGMPTGTGIDSLPELWGFTGTVCGDCTTGPPRQPANPMTGWQNPYFAQEACDGMCVRASLCCCTTPNSGYVEGPSGPQSRCGGSAGPKEHRKRECRCNTTCYKFTMEPFDCHEIDNSVICPTRTGITMSACSPCSYIQGPVETGIVGDLPPLPSYTGCTWDCESYSTRTGSAMGSWDVWANCLPDVARDARECGVIPYTGSAECSGQCPSTGGGASPGAYNTQMMLLVDGVYKSQCDCATGEFYLLCHNPDDPAAPPPIYTPSGVGVLREVYVKFTGLLSQSC